MATIDINDASNYRFEVKDDKVMLFGPFVGFLSDEMQVCTKEQPRVILSNGNMAEQVLRIHLPRLKGAKMVERERIPFYDQTPSGRYYQRGTVECETWDLSACFK